MTYKQLMESLIEGEIYLTCDISGSITASGMGAASSEQRRSLREHRGEIERQFRQPFVDHVTEVFGDCVIRDESTKKVIRKTSGTGELF